jgi:HK97 gp10 family phage protein
MTTFKFEGGRELEAALKQFGRPMAKRIGTRALKKAADPILKAYQAGTKVLTGTLVRSETAGTKLNRRQSRMNKRLGKSEVEVHIGTSDPAGIMEEFGNAHQSASPALRPAWDAEGDERALNRIRDELWADIEKTAARVKKKG